MKDDLISKQEAIDALERIFDRCEEIEAHLPEGDPDRTGYKMYPDYVTVWKYLKQLPSAQPEITPDGTLKVTVDADISKVGRILLSQAGTQYGGLYYKDAQPEMTLESAIDYLHSIGWMQEHDRVLSSAQPEIIRCKDCGNWDTTWQNDWAKNYHYCPIIDGVRNGDWYCADAERKTDD